MANVAAGVVWPPLFQEDRLDSGLEKLVIKRRPLRGEWYRRVEGDRRRCQKTGKNSLLTDVLQMASGLLVR
jgi:hypothetical protein